ncbi:MAG: hypothetical protein ABGX47_11080 [Martelella sp.]|uniref:hypothetical protein n=1 Tax=Martelella sp. TaxID=1969699 RepID=UPI003242654A
MAKLSSGSSGNESDNRDLDRKTAELLARIKSEPVPDRLLKLALQLQDALNEKEKKGF